MRFIDPACVREVCQLQRVYEVCHAFAGLGKDMVSEPARESMARPVQRRPDTLAVVEFDLAARRQLAPMRVRVPDPCRAQWYP